MQVILSSSAHKRGNVQLDDLDFKKSGYDQWKSYGQSKTANIWSALEIERRYGSQGEQCSCTDAGPRSAARSTGLVPRQGEHRDLPESYGLHSASNWGPLSWQAAAMVPFITSNQTLGSRHRACMVVIVHKPACIGMGICRANAHLQSEHV